MGDVDGAFKAARGLKREDIPEPADVDTEIINLWYWLQLPLARGCAADLVGWVAEASNLDIAGKLELWERLAMVDSIVTSQNARQAAYDRQRRQG